MPGPPSVTWRALRRTMRPVSDAHRAAVLVVDDDPLVRAVAKKLLGAANLKILEAASAEQALARLGPEVALVVTDLVMPGKDGAALLAEVREKSPSVPVIIMTAHATIESAVELMRAGAFDYVVKPISAESLLPRVERALENLELGRALSDLRVRAAMSGARETILGETRPMVELVGKLPQYAAAEMPVLVTGESGTGKELVARALHDLSPRASGPFVPVNCGAVAEELFESELFGHVRGAFTDARADRVGLTAEADGGTLFLDEVGELSPRSQVKLLRFLQTGEIRPVGSDATRSVNARIVSATHRDLDAMIARGDFREDIFYRLGVLAIRIPPLRERREDVPLFARRFVERFARDLGVPTPRLTPAALQRLVAWDWPGNVREMENVLRRALVLCDGPEIDAAAIELGPRATGGAPAASEAPRTLQEAKARAIAEVERSFVIRCLTEGRGNIALAARLAGKDRKSFWELMRKYEVDADPFRTSS